MADALTAGEIMNALRVRDEIAHRINRINRATSRGEKVTVEHGKVIAEKLIELGYVDVAKVHETIVNEGENDEGDEDDFDLADL